MTTRSDDRVVVELGCGVTVYPAVEAGGRWRAVWNENGRRRQCESVSEDGLAGRLEPVIEPRVSVAGESGLFVDSAEIPADMDVARLGQRWARAHGYRMS